MSAHDHAAADALRAAIGAVDFEGLTRGALRGFPRDFAALVAGEPGAADTLRAALARPAAALAAPFLIDALALPASASAVDRPGVLALLADLAAATPEVWIGKPIAQDALWFGHRNTRRAVAARLLERRDGGAPSAEALLADPDPAIRAGIAGLIAWLDPEAVAALLAPLRGLHADPDPAARGVALLARGNLGAPLDELNAGLDDPDAAVRICAAVALARRAGPELPERAVAVLETDAAAAHALAGFPWYAGAPAALARAQYLHLDARFRARVLAHAGSLLRDDPDPWPVVEPLLQIAFPGPVRASWQAPLPALDEPALSILRVVLEQPAWLEDRRFSMFNRGRMLPQLELALRRWAGLPLATPRWFPVRRAISFGDRTRDVAVWVMDHSDGGVPESEALARAIAGALDDDDLARVALAWHVEHQVNDGRARVREIALPAVAAELPADPTARRAAGDAYLDALAAAGWVVEDDLAAERGNNVVVWRDHERATMSYVHDGPRAYLDVRARWSLTRALARVGGERPGFVPAALRHDPEGDRALALYLWASPADATPPPALDEIAVRFQGRRQVVWYPISQYLRRLPLERREPIVVTLLESTRDKKSALTGLVELLRWCRTDATLALAVEAFERGLTWTGQGLDERIAQQLVAATGPGALPLLEQLAAKQRHPRIDLALARCRAAAP